MVGVPADDGRSIEVSETKLPGIGFRQDFVTGSGRRIGVVSQRDGRRSLLLFSRDDPDACSQVVELTPAESDALASFLGSGKVIERLASLSEQVAALATGKVRIANGSRFDGLTLGATRARTRTGASIVALIRGANAIPSPGPETDLHGDDVLIVVGTVEAIAALREIVNE